MNAFDQKRQLLDFYDQLTANDSLFTLELIDLFKQRREALQYERFSIAFLGRFNAGKSTLINKVFLGEDILPTAMYPENARLVHIVHGERNRLILRSRDGKDQEVIESNMNAIKEALQKYATYPGGNAKYDYLELCWSNSKVLQDGVTLIDTVGTEDPQDSKDEITESMVNATFLALEKASAVVILLMAMQALTDSEQKVIIKHLSQSSKKVFVVVNYADVLDEKSEQEVREDLTKRLSQFFLANGIRADNRILFTSGKTGKERGLSELRQCLVNFIAEDRVKEIIFQHASDLRKGLVNQKTLFSHQLIDVQAKKRGDEQQLRELCSQMEYIQEDIKGRQQALQNSCVDLIKHGEDKLCQKLKISKEDLLSRVDKEPLDRIAELFAAAIDNIGSTYDVVVREERCRVKECFAEHIENWNSGFDPETFRSRFEFPKMDWSAGEISGTTSILLGTGIAGFGGWTYATAGWMATLLAATPPGMVLVAAGLGLATIGAVLFGKAKIDEARKERTKMRKVIYDLYRDAEKGTKEDLKANIDAFFTLHLEQIRSHAETEEKRLRNLINEKDVSELDRQADELEKASIKLDQFIKSLPVI